MGSSTAQAGAEPDRKPASNTVEPKLLIEKPATLSGARAPRPKIQAAHKLPGLDSINIDRSTTTSRYLFLLSRTTHSERHNRCGIFLGPGNKSDSTRLLLNYTASSLYVVPQRVAYREGAYENATTCSHDPLLTGREGKGTFVTLSACTTTQMQC